MQKLNLKYFMGSFFLSLVAVFIATKAYLVMSLSTQQNETDETTVESKNIELFAANEESDPIYEKYKKLSAAEAPLGSDAVIAPTNTVVEAPNTAASDEILYAADDGGDWVKGSETYSSDDILSTAFSAETATDVSTVAEAEDAPELQIADASAAPNFTIPLKHNFKIETGVVSVSDEADGGRIALASKNVSIYNLGTENTADVTEPLATDGSDEVADNTDATEHEVYTQDNYNDPWEVAETANKHVTKNTYGTKSEPLQQEVTLPDAQAPDEQKVAYDLRPNILVPIPEDIMNDKNLTPQFSTSKENLQLEQELRDKHQLPELKEEEKIQNRASSVSGGKVSADGVIPSIDDEKDFDSDVKNSGKDADDDDDEQTSRSLSDSVAAWFDGIMPSKSASGASAPKNNKSSKDKHSSIFQRLLGNQPDQQEIMPTELKLSFQPNRAEISGQTLEWLHAFADNAVNNDNVIVEIRVDRSASFEVQQKRLTMLYKIFADSGVEQRKVNILFTDREPNSFIIRNVRFATDEQRIEATKRADNPWN